MLKKHLEQLINTYQDFPTKGILFRDITPVLAKPEVFSELIDKMSSLYESETIDAIIAVDARGFLFGSAIALKMSKPLIVARKPGKLPGEILEEKYDLEYGSNSLAIQKESLNIGNNFLVIDDLLATGGTVNCINRIIRERKKNIIGLCVVVELVDLKGRDLLPFEVKSILKY